MNSKDNVRETGLGATGVKMINARTNVVREKVTALKAELLGTMKLFWSKIMFELLRQIVALVFLVLRQK